MNENIKYKKCYCCNIETPQDQIYKVRTTNNNNRELCLFCYNRRNQDKYLRIIESYESQMDEFRKMFILGDAYCKLDNTPLPKIKK